MKYAMPVHPKVLEQDFETTVDLNSITDMYLALKDKSLSDLDDDTLNRIGKYLEKAWLEVNSRLGVNLRDREKLYPLFFELNRIFGGKKKAKAAYRGVRLSSALDSNDISKTYPNSINEPDVLEHLESLAYGLRSWTKKESLAEHWANNPYRYTEKDMIVFQIEKPDLVIEDGYVSEYFWENHKLSFLDPGELVLYIKNPKILSIVPSDEEERLYYVKIKDMG